MDRLKEIIQKNEKRYLMFLEKLVAYDTSVIRHEDTRSGKGGAEISGRISGKYGMCS